MARIAAVDFGLKRIGIAISDEKGVVALPLQVVLADKTFEKSAQKIFLLLKPYEKDLETIVVGLPLLLNGKKGDMALHAEHFASVLRMTCSFNVVCFDERFSSAQADRALKEIKLNRRKRSQIVDVTAAMMILQCYLSLKNSSL